MPKNNRDQLIATFQNRTKRRRTVPGTRSLTRPVSTSTRSDPLVLPQAAAKKYGPAYGAAVSLRQKRGRQTGLGKRPARY